jgi:hypothetical protein
VTDAPYPRRVRGDSRLSEVGLGLLPFPLRERAVTGHVDPPAAVCGGSAPLHLLIRNSSSPSPSPNARCASFKSKTVLQELGLTASMMTTYPAPDIKHSVERLESFPRGVKVARWVIRDDNNQHYHGVVQLSQSPLLIELKWKPTSAGAEQLVGRYRLSLAELLSGDFVRFEREGETGDNIRLRFYRGSDGIVSIQARADRPGLPIGVVTL